MFQNEKLLAYLNDNTIRSEKSTFDHVVYDSEIEASFAQRFENDENVKKYMLNCQTGSKSTSPISAYLPDWALVIDNDGEEKLYFVLETKGAEIEEFLRPEERAKIDFARKHFEAIGTSIEFIGPEKDVNQLMLRALSC